MLVAPDHLQRPIQMEFFASDLHRRHKTILIQDVRQEVIQIVNNLRDPESLYTFDVAGLRVKRLLVQLANKAQTEQDGVLAKRLLDNVMNLSRSESDKELVTKLHCLTMEAWIRTRSPRGRDEAEILFWRLLRERQNFMTDNIQTNQYLYNDAFCIIVNALTISSKRKRLWPEKAKRVDTILQAVKSFWKDPQIPLSPNTPAINTVLKVYMKERKVTETRSVLLSLLHAWINGDESLRPTKVTFNTAMFTFALTGNADLAMELIRYMIQLHEQKFLTFPDGHAFASLLHSHTKSKDPNAGEKAEQVMEWILDLHEREKISDLKACSPTQMASSVMQSWSQSGRPEKVDTMLRRIANDSKDSGSYDITPDPLLFWAAVHAWGQSNKPERGERAEALLELMQETCEYHQLDIAKCGHVFKEVIRIWLHVTHDPTAGEHALSIVQKMKRLGISPGKLEQKVEWWMAWKKRRKDTQNFSLRLE